ncbi:hypothetical protein OPS25_15200 [Alteromonas ponticola]|uniref:Glycosyl-hydrolase 97 N-terminal domain-containing protein n=1 Tax=Alteromonas aquimaris TaxID=2998417 RepID=A0ABT3PAQ4_9ALTE|nr:hypothetical protein [Alteromonas aquimaris]MCW8109852.1 hypothetical protein [Alteromonas aquimaris]
MKKCLLLATCLIASATSYAKINVVPLERYGKGHFKLNVSINGRSSTFMFDADASGTVIDSSKLDYFGIEPSASNFDGIAVGNEQQSKSKPRRYG